MSADYISNTNTFKSLAVFHLQPPWTRLVDSLTAPTKEEKQLVGQKCDRYIFGPTVITVCPVAVT